MPKNSQKAIESRRDRVWEMILRGHNPQSIKSELNIPRTTVYRDIRYLTHKSKEYVYQIAKGGFALAYQRSIEGVSFTMSQAWRKFLDDRVPEKHKPAYLRLIKDCHESMMQQVINGPAVFAMDNLRKRIERAGINIEFNNADFNYVGVDERGTVDTDKYESHIN